MVFPVGFTCANSDLIFWSAGPENAEMVRTIIERWAKAPGENFLVNGAHDHWLEAWSLNPGRGRAVLDKVWGVISVSIIIVLFLTWMSVRSKNIKISATTNREFWIGIVFVALSALAGLVFGFVTAPDPRFWWGSLITLLITLVIVGTHLAFSNRLFLNSLIVFFVYFLTVISITGYASMTISS